MRILLIGLGVLVIFACVTLWRATRNEAQAEADYPALGNFVTVDGQAVHYEQFGQGPDVVLIHGASGNTRDLTFGLAPALQDRYRVTVFDRPGLGYSDAGEDLSITGQARVLTQAAQQIGLTQPIVLGTSYGGSVALAWALTQTDFISSLVLVSAPSLPWDTPPPRVYQINTHPVLGPISRPLISAWVPSSYVAQEIEKIFEPDASPIGYADFIGAGLTLRRPSLYANALQRVTLRDEIEDIAQHYEQLTLPVQLVHGTKDTIVGASIHSIPLAKTLPNAELTLIEGAGHMPHHTHPDLIVDAVDRALAATVRTQ